MSWGSSGSVPVPWPCGMIVLLRWMRLGWLEFGEDLVEQLPRLVGGGGADADALHDVQVLVDLVGLVQVERAGEVLQVDDVGQLLIGEAQDAEGSDHCRGGA